MTYYEEKAKQDNIDELQTVKESLLEENDKIKKFKEALKDKLIIYQQRIQFLKVSLKVFLLRQYLLIRMRNSGQHLKLNNYKIIRLKKFKFLQKSK
jgi:hypothetical protein